jgi:hypothetical protein
MEREAFVSVRMPQSLATALSAAARLEGISRSDALRQLSAARVADVAEKNQPRAVEMSGVPDDRG